MRNRHQRSKAKERIAPTKLEVDSEPTTTVRLDEDVVALVERTSRERSMSVEAVVNECLREGLSQIQSLPQTGKRLETKVFDLGQCLLEDLDDISRVLAIAEGEAYK